MDQGINNSQKFFTMNLAISFNKKDKLMKIKINMMKEIFSNLWKHGSYIKIINVNFYLIKGLEKSTWIKSEIVINEIFKYWITILTFDHQPKCLSIQIKQVKMVIILKKCARKHDLKWVNPTKHWACWIKFVVIQSTMIWTLNEGSFEC
jgi:hypothetical protein